jgi:1,4-dihydroxy-2-naphthoyl-CoA hydrolase
MSGLTIPWREGVSLELLNAYARNTMVENLGIVFTELTGDYLRGTMPVNERSCQPMGVLHGGASVAFAETLASTASNATMDDAHRVLGQEINANHLRPVPVGEHVVGTTYLLHAGARSQVWSIEICNARGQLTCISRITMAVINRR